MKKPLKIILIILAVIVGLVAALLIWLTATQLNVKTETAVVTAASRCVRRARLSWKRTWTASSAP